MGGHPSHESGVKDEKAKKAEAAFQDLQNRWLKACMTLDELGKPQWKRTTEAMLCFKKLNISHMPERWRQRLDQTFLQINSVTEQYPIETWEDYQTVSSDDLTKIGSLIRKML